MKNIFCLLTVIGIFAVFSCSNGGGNTSATANNKRSHQADTGFTGVENYKVNGVVKKTVSYKNGVKDGLTKTYFNAAAVDQEIPYVDGKKNGISKGYYIDGFLFRTTPYENDTINGEQIQYYKSGKVRARMKYDQGKRYPGLDEYEMDGTKISNYPKLVYHINDNYKEKGSIKILVEMSDMSEGTKYYRGKLTNGMVNLDACKPLLQSATTGYVDMRKTAGVSADSVHIIGAYLTKLGNRYFMQIAIPLPYKDLN
jgi:antitoxin component YwqK of YwqJK toxin-antitoxin module